MQEDGRAECGGERVAPCKPSLIDQISVGELPLDAAELEEQLTRIFKTASHWKS